jgi:methylated-DNA-protein-cysteine methyltransferase related protein
MSRVDAEFKERVYALVARIPAGRVMTYGQVAALCGAAWAAWEVGQTAHTGPADLPWQRVVNKQGGLASGYPGGKAGHKAALEAENISVTDEYAVEVSKLLWNPDQRSLL